MEARASGLKYTVVGAGAIGAYVGAALARGGADVTLLARGPHLAAMRERGGVEVRSARGDFDAKVNAVASLDEIERTDVAIVALKAHQFVEFAPKMEKIARGGATIVAMQNGIPWWYFQKHGGPYDGLVLESVDPGGRLGALFPTEQVLGCVVYSSTEIEAPGIIKHVEGTRFSLGQPDREIGDRTRAIAADLIAGGLRAPIETELRNEIWLKLLGNASFNPISALTRQTLVEIADDPLVEPIVREMMLESVAIAEKLGIVLTITIDKRIDGARRVGHHKTSTLQDIEAGKPLELDALTGVVVELGEKTGTPTPATRHVYALAKAMERSVLAGR